jgi:hypothetical protein
LKLVGPSVTFAIAAPTLINLVAGYYLVTIGGIALNPVAAVNSIDIQLDGATVASSTISAAANQYVQLYRTEIIQVIPANAPLTIVVRTSTGNANFTQVTCVINRLL